MLDGDGRQEHERRGEHQPDGPEEDVEHSLEPARRRSNGESFGEDELRGLELADEDLPRLALVEADPLLDLDAAELDLEELLDREGAAPVGVGDQHELDAFGRDEVARGRGRCR